METTYMIDPATFKLLLRQSRVHPETLAAALQREASIIYAWMRGDGQIPQYISLTLDAVRARRDPADDDTMRNVDLVGILGIADQQRNFWIEANQFPAAARFAVAEHQARSAGDKPLSTQERRVLKNIYEAGRYFRARNGWRARPILGKNLPQMRPETPDRFRRLGLVRENHDNRGNKFIELTPLGKDKVLK
jgi:hypothetical protein